MIQHRQWKRETTAVRRGRTDRMEPGRRERRRLQQLLICVLLFAVMFASKGSAHFNLLREELGRAVFGSMDVKAVLSDLGWVLSAGRPMSEAVETIWSGMVFPAEPEPVPPGSRGAGYRAGLRLLSGPDRQTFWPMGDEPRLPTAMERSCAPPVPTPTPEPEVIHMEYTGPALPDNTTMDRYALGLEHTVSPVMGAVTSGFGWRQHPIDGVQKFHKGVDLTAPMGTAIGAFADGVVDYVGEGEGYGRYLQLKHDNGVTSFYCHCSRILVQQGQTVAAGETIAESGATGKVTGPHLHFELRKNGLLLQPLYYIETLP